MSDRHQYVDEGLRVLLAEDFFIYVVRESDELVFVYETEVWPEWLELPENAPVLALIPVAHNHQPYRLAKSQVERIHARDAGEQMTLREWEAERQQDRRAA